MLQRVFIPLIQVKSGKTCADLLNENCQIIYSLNRPNEITKILQYNITKVMQNG